jgi:hypothetical protein
MTVRLQLVIDCRKPDPLAHFWAAALGYELEPPPGGFATWDDYWRDVGVVEEELGLGQDCIVDPDRTARASGCRSSLIARHQVSRNSASQGVALRSFIGAGSGTPAAYIEDVLKRVMVVVLLGCLGLTAGLAFGTFSTHQPRIHFSTGPAPNICQHHSRVFSPSDLRPHHPTEHHLKSPSSFGPKGQCLVSLVKSPAVIVDSAPWLPIGGYVLLGLLAGLSAAIGFLVPPKSRASAF